MKSPWSALVMLAISSPLVSAEPGATPFTGTFTLHVENDTFSPGGDESYTQGLELLAGLEKDPLPFMGRALGALAGKRNYRAQTSLVIGQTIFTPQNIVTYEPRMDDRPFVGHLYGGLSWGLTAPVWTKDEGRWRRPRRYMGRIVLGATGPVASGHTAQSAFHVLREGRIPKGWYTQAGNRPEVSAMLTREDGVKVFGLRYERINITTMGRVLAGTLQDFAAVGATLRVGDNLTAFPPGNIPESAADAVEPKVEWAVFGGGQGRVFALNRLADQGGNELRPDFVPFVKEWNVGAYARFKNGFGVSYTVIRRSKEIDPLPEGLRAQHWIGALQFSKTPNPTVSECDCLARWLAGTRAELFLGRGRSEVEEIVPAVPELSLSGHWGIERVIFSDRFALTAETIGVVREHGPHTADPGHKDTFLLAKAISFGVELLPRRIERHRVQLRVGGGKASVKTQTTPAEGGIEQPELPEPAADSGSSALAGLRYTFRTGKPLSVGTDFTYVRLYLDGEQTGVRRARLWSWTVGVQVHPWGRDRADAPTAEPDDGGLVDRWR